MVSSFIDRFLVGTTGGLSNTATTKTATPSAATSPSTSFLSIGSTTSRNCFTTTYNVPSSSKILANSIMSREHKDIINMRIPCEDRRGFLDHLRPNTLVKSTIRLSILQGTHILTHYMNDQVRMDLERDAAVQEGRMTPEEAEEKAAKWTEREWILRWKEFPHRTLVALGKFHAITLVMRWYEHILSNRVDILTLDKLTLDTFADAKRRDKQHPEGLAWNVSEAPTTFLTTFNASLITFVADYSVHQVILMYGYYLYIQEQRKQSKRQRESKTGTVTELHTGSLFISFLKRSTTLILSRALGLVFASLGATLGTLFWPGWGTIAGNNMGDSLSASVFPDDSISINTSSTKKSD